MTLTDDFKTLKYSGGKWGFIDKTGKVIIPLIYSETEPFAQGLARVKTDENWFLINPKGECVSGCKYAPTTHLKAK